MTYKPIPNCRDCGMALERECARYCPWCLRLRADDFWRWWEDEQVARMIGRHVERELAA